MCTETYQNDKFMNAPFTRILFCVLIYKQEQDVPKKLEKYAVVRNGRMRWESGFIFAAPSFLLFSLSAP